MRPTPAPQVVEWLEAQQADDLRLPSISVTELVYGAHRLPDGKRKRELMSRVALLVERTFKDKISDFDARSAVVCGALMAEHPEIEIEDRYADFQIAAIALAGGFELATRNTKDFTFSNLRLINPWG